MTYTDILECLKAIQKVINNNYQDPKNEVKEKCLKKLILELYPEKETKTFIKKELKINKQINDYIVNIISKISKIINEKRIEIMSNTLSLLQIKQYFELLKEIEENKNNKEKLEEILNKIPKEPEIFNNLKEKINTLIQKIKCDSNLNFKS